MDTLFHWISAGASENHSSDTLSVAVACNRQIAALLQNSITLLSQFESLLAETVSQENIINVLQFLAVEAIFIENQAKDKEYVITNQGIESLRVVSMGILRQVNLRFIVLMNRYSLVIPNREVLFSMKFYQVWQNCLQLVSRQDISNSLTESQYNSSAL